MVTYELEESYYNDNIASGCYSRLYGGSFMQTSWSQIAETTLPLKESKLSAANNQGQFQASIEVRSKQLSKKLILVNLISLLVNLVLAIVGFYFSFVNNSPSTTAFAADCVLDFMSSGIVLWRYHGDLSSVYMHAREQIACIYLGALFEISAIAIIIKASSDMASQVDTSLETDLGGSNELVYLAIVATIACSVLTVFKCALYKTLRDNSILLDVINTLISTVFAMSIVMSQVLINVNPSFWYLDPILSIVLALFMMGFGIKVIHQNFNILKPVHYNYNQASCETTLNGTNNNNYKNTEDLNKLLSFNNNYNNNNIGTLSKQQQQHHGLTNQSDNYGSNLLNSIEQNRQNKRTDYSSISFN